MVSRRHEGEKGVPCEHLLKPVGVKQGIAHRHVGVEQHEQLEEQRGG